MKRRVLVCIQHFSAGSYFRRIQSNRADSFRSSGEPVASGLEILGNGYTAFFLWMVANRIGVPIPATPALVVAGALSGLGELHLASIVLLALVATLISDSIWFHLGRKYGLRILRYLYRVTLAPDSYVRKTEDFLLRHGYKSLLIMKFVPGMNRTVLPLTGAFRLKYPRFLALDAVGAVIWVGAYSGIGYAFSNELEEATRQARQFGWYTAALAAALVVLVCTLVKYVERRHAR